jgi:hypothetical protein
LPDRRCFGEVGVDRDIAEADACALLRAWGGREGVPVDAVADASDADPSVSSKTIASLPLSRRRLLGGALIILLLAFAFWAAALALPR